MRQSSECLIYSRRKEYMTTTNYVKLTNNLEALKLYTIKENLPAYIDMINAGTKTTIDALYELTEKEMNLKSKERFVPVYIRLDFLVKKHMKDLISTFNQV